MKRLIFDLDDTICFTENSEYNNSVPNLPLIEKIKEYKLEGFEIIISTSRNMRTYEGSIGKINANTLPIIINWLEKNGVPYDEIYIGKPWCGFQGFYIDDKAIRPSEFASMSYEDIQEMLAKENPYRDGSNR